MIGGSAASADVLLDVLVRGVTQLVRCTVEDHFSITKNQKCSLRIHACVFDRDHFIPLLVIGMRCHDESILKTMSHH